MTDDIRAWNEKAAFEFAGGWKQVGPKLKGGLKMCTFKFVEPEKKLGMSYDGLVYVNGNWRIFPKAWRAAK